jgi:hypothetical protein
MRGRWCATGCGILLYRRHSASGSLRIHGVHTYIDTVAEIAEVLLQRRLSGCMGLEAIRFPGRLAHGPPAFEAVSMMCHDLQNVHHCHTVSPRSAVLRVCFHACFALSVNPSSV